jgi:hypothetical protein
VGQLSFLLWLLFDYLKRPKRRPSSHHHSNKTAKPRFVSKPSSFKPIDEFNIPSAILLVQFAKKILESPDFALLYPPPLPSDASFSAT